jgi:hypothetical protein
MSAPIQEAPLAQSAPTAVVVRGSELTNDARNLAKIADFLGVTVQHVPLGAVDKELERLPAVGRYHVLCSASTLAAAFAGYPAGTLPPLFARAESVYVYAFDKGEPSTALLRSLTGCSAACMIETQGPIQSLQVSSNHQDITGALTDVTIRAESTGCPLMLHIPTSADAGNRIVSGVNGDLLRFVDLNAVRFYLSAAHEVIDLDSGAASKFDVRKHAATVPLVLYLQQAFQEVRWLPSEIGACVVIDDPPLWTRYGFVSLEALSRSVREHEFAATMAFIPWNWDRTEPDAIATFRDNPGRMSICMHGCDHTAAEFATRDADLLNKRIKIAKSRMHCLTQRTGLPSDPVMVFPQGNFSVEAGRALKLNGLMAAVNTEVSPRDGTGRTTSIAETWNMAISTFGTFPLFPRRYMSDGIENFAFDSFLGKPCIIASHHDDFRDNGRAVLDFVATLNGLRTKLTWRPIGDLVRRGYKVRRNATGEIAIQMFGSELHIESRLGKAALGTICKAENDADSVNAVMLDHELAAYSSDTRELHITADLTLGKHRIVTVTYADVLPAEPPAGSAAYRLKVATRRALSEFRDNYISRSEMLSKFAARARRSVKRN